MDDFLYVLRLSLEGHVPEEYIRQQLQSYEAYFGEHAAAGEPLERTLRRLGDPTKVAELIVEDYRMKQERLARSNFEVPLFFGNGDGEKAEELDTAEKINAKIKNPEHGIKAEFKEDQGWDVRLGKFKLNSWYGTLLILLVVVVIYTLIRQTVAG